MRPTFPDVFVLPPDASLPSGGNLYNRLFLRALRRERFPFEIMSLGQAVRAAPDRPGARFWADSLYLDELADPARAAAFGPRLFLIVHWIPSRDPGLESREADERRRREDAVFAHAAGFLATSPRTRRALSGRGQAGKPIIVVRPALAVAPRGRKPAASGFRAVIAANLVRSKGILEFLRRLGTSTTHKDAFVIRIAGRSDIEPPYAKACLAEIRRSWPGGRIVFTGPKTPGRMRALYETSAVFVTASRMETYGMAVREAMAFGLPVLALRAPYVRSIPRGRGVLRIYDSVEALAEGCAALIRSPEELAGLRERAWRRRLREAYSWEDAARLFIRRIRSIEASLRHASSASVEGRSGMGKAMRRNPPSSPTPRRP